MKNFIIILCYLFVLNSHSQTPKVYKYHIYLKNELDMPTFALVGNVYKYSGNNTALKSFFDKYNILNFDKEYPTLTADDFFEKIINVQTTSSVLATAMLTQFPTLFASSIDLTDFPEPELDFYPNDYGTTSPIPYSGVNIERSDLDYINVQKAWDLTTGRGTKIGISDGRIKANDQDFINKISFIQNTLQSVAYNPNNIESYHGTAIAGIAAAKGNNGYGSTGVCYDCEIISTRYGVLNNLVLLAQAGVRVINMSWVNIFQEKKYFSDAYQQQVQLLINRLTQDYKVVFVASAGNMPSYQTDTDIYGCSNRQLRGTVYGFPASLDNVISVSTVIHKPTWSLPLSVTPTTTPLSTNPVSGYYGQTPTMKLYFLQDAVSCVNGNDPNNPFSTPFHGWAQPNCPNGLPTTPNGMWIHHTTNPDVDILAPTHDTFKFDKFAEENGAVVYGGQGTSGAAPFVAGTAALMINLNTCLTPQEVDTILKLTSKDVENTINQFFAGQIGAGALQTGNAVEFVNEMKKLNGNATIKNHIFNRFNFNLQKINNNLVINNVTFKDECKVDFTAKKSISLVSGTLLKPTTGAISLKINEDFVITCDPVTSPFRKANTSSNDSKSILSTDQKAVILPNPNNGLFAIKRIDFEIYKTSTIAVEIYDLNGRILFKNIISENDNDLYNFDCSDLTNGLYICKLSSEFYQQEIKFFRN